MIRVEALPGPPLAEQEVEIVERKGRGHPDTICDSVADAISVALCREYRNRCGEVLHHNMDKSLLAAGGVRLRFGGGEVVRPMELIVGDRATFCAGAQVFPVEEIAVETARGWFRENLRFVDPDRHVTIRSVLDEGSAELSGLFAHRGPVLPANDTSGAVGHWPLSPTEDAVLALEGHLNSSDFKERFPETGEDVKVMALREGRDLDLTLAMPLLAPAVASEAHYFARKAEVHGAVEEFLRSRAGAGFRSSTVRYNALDEEGRGIHGVYLSLLGTSAEGADSGQVGRGNRVNGLISVCRPLGTEAAAGKNPVSHVGKIYNVLAFRLARQICQRCEGVAEAQVLLLSRIGSLVDAPRLAAARVHLVPGRTLSDVRPAVEGVVEEGLGGVGELCLELAAGRHPVC